MMVKLILLVLLAYRNTMSLRGSQSGRTAVSWMGSPQSTQSLELTDCADHFRAVTAVSHLKISLQV